MACSRCFGRCPPHIWCDGGHALGQVNRWFCFIVFVFLYCRGIVVIFPLPFAFSFLPPPFPELAHYAHWMSFAFFHRLSFAPIAPRVAQARWASRRSLL